MTDFPSYAYGTVSVDAGGTVVTGTDTLWSGVNARAGDDITIAGHTVIVVDVTDETHLTIDAWPYDAVTGGDYKITQRSPLRFVGGVARADLTTLLSTLEAKGLVWTLNAVYADPDNAKPPLTAAEGQLIYQPTTGKFWEMQDGAWASIASPYGLQAASNLSDLADLATARSNMGIYDYDSIAEASAATITAPQNAIRTGGYAAAGDGGGALYARAGSEPSHAGKFQSMDGAWWELSETVPNVKMFGAKGDGSTVDTAAFQNAFDYLPVTPRGGEVVVPRSLSPYIVDDTLSLNGRIGVRVRGGGGFTGGSSPASEIRYTGVGDRFIDARDSVGVTIEDISIIYTSASFTGYLIDAGGNTAATVSPPSFGSASAKLTIRNAVLSTSQTTGTATLLNLDQSFEALCENVNFSKGCPSIRGAQVYAGTTTTARIVSCQFVGHHDAAISGGTESWTFDGCAFEADDNGRANAYENTAHGNIASKGLNFRACWFGDITTVGGTWITFHGSGLSITDGSVMSSNSASNNVGIEIAGASTGLSITGSVFVNFTYFIRASATLAGLHVKGCTFISVTTPLTGLSNISNMDVDDGNSPSIAQPWSTFTPTIASSSGTITDAGGTASYKINGKTVCFRITATITTAGTGSGRIIISGLPWTWKTAIAFGGFDGGYSVAVAGYANANTTSINVVNYDATYPGRSGSVLTVSGVGEIA